MRTTAGCCIALPSMILMAFGLSAALAQNPVFMPPIDIDQTRLLKNCAVATDTSCAYPLKDMLNSGGDFWTTPFQPYDPVTKTGDGYGEGMNGPRAAQRHAFNPSNPEYHFLRLNGLDSQSCFECHNSTGSETVDARGALIRKPYGVAGSAGGNSNAFINPMYPTPQTMFIRQPPAVFGSGYQQAVGDEMTMTLLIERESARMKAKASGKPVTVPLSANGVSFGTFTTTYHLGTPALVLHAGSQCPASATPKNIGGETEFMDDLSGLVGVSCDLFIRPLQWKGVASSLRHFVRDALDFHLSMQAFEKVGLCDCDLDGKGGPATGPEVTIGQVTAMTSFVAMTRPPVQLPLVSASEQRGQMIFLGDKTIPGLYQNMCANCHVGPMKLQTPEVLVEWPVNSLSSTGENINPDPTQDQTWPIPQNKCPAGNPKPKNGCPVESVYLQGDASMSLLAKNQGSLVTPSVSSEALALKVRYNINLARMRSNGVEHAAAFLSSNSLSGDDMASAVKALRAPPPPQPAPAGVAQALLATPVSVVGQAYVIPLTLPDADVTPTQLPRLPANPDGTVNVPLLSDLKRHKMGSGLTDLVNLPGQGTDVQGISNVPGEFLTRPLWGVADTGPWLHDGRALTLRDAILMHGNSATGSEAGPVVDAFAKLPPDDQQAVVDFLLTLRLPPPGGFTAVQVAAK